MRFDAAVIFDVDGVLLDLTPAEEDAFFWAFSRLHGLEGLSCDWDSYRIRNDEDIITEILSGHFGRPPSRREQQAIIHAYLNHLASDIQLKRVIPSPIDGAGELLQSLRDRAELGIATANLLEAAELRLNAVTCGAMYTPVLLAPMAAAPSGTSSHAPLPARVFPASALSSSATISTTSKRD